MSRSPAHRLAALLAPVFLLFTGTGEALGMHPCPHHSYIEGAAAGAPVSEPASGHGEHGAAHAEHPAPPAAADGDHHAAADPAEHPEHGTCTCLGGCPPLGLALPSGEGVEIAVPAPADVLRVRPEGERPNASPIPFVLPYGHAPPAAA